MFSTEKFPCELITVRWFFLPFSDASILRHCQHYSALLLSQIRLMALSFAGFCWHLLMTLPLHSVLAHKYSRENVVSGFCCFIFCCCIFLNMYFVFKYCFVSLFLIICVCLPQISTFNDLIREPYTYHRTNMAVPVLGLDFRCVYYMYLNIEKLVSKEWYQTKIQKY